MFKRDGGLVLHHEDIAGDWLPIVMIQIETIDKRLFRSVIGLYVVRDFKDYLVRFVHIEAIDRIKVYATRSFLVEG